MHMLLSNQFISEHISNLRKRSRNKADFKKSCFVMWTTGYFMYKLDHKYKAYKQMNH